MGRNVSKENAVLNWCQKHEISAEQVMAFGDDWNDIGLFNMFSGKKSPSSRSEKGVAQRVGGG
ncbi:HAD hydrolase family protein [Bacillus sp. TL12]|nr:HAD hydrolase family protein [Bacillus sp. TL12]MCI0765048.1 HAD hydrolase family protein [Bacillus sp. TL12]